MNYSNADPPGLLTAAQVVSMTGVSKSTLRHWEREFRDFLETAIEEQNGRRLFRADAVSKIERIKALVLEQGLTLQGVRKHLQSLATDKRTLPLTAVEEKARRLADIVTDHIIKRLFTSVKQE